MSFGSDGDGHSYTRNQIFALTLKDFVLRSCATSLATVWPPSMPPSRKPRISRRPIRTSEPNISLPLPQSVKIFADLTWLEPFPRSSGKLILVPVLKDGSLDVLLLRIWKKALPGVQGLFHAFFRVQVSPWQRASKPNQICVSIGSCAVSKKVSPLRPVISTTRQHTSHWRQKTVGRVPTSICLVKQATLQTALVTPELDGQTHLQNAFVVVVGERPLWETSSSFSLVIRICRSPTDIRTAHALMLARDGNISRFSPCRLACPCRCHRS